MMAAAFDAGYQHRHRAFAATALRWEIVRRSTDWTAQLSSASIPNRRT